MPLTDGELDRVRAELGYNVLNIGAEPYIGIHAIFGQVIQPYLREGADTTSNTAVSAAGASGAVVTLTVASVTGITAHSQVAVDVDELFEIATVRAVNTGASTVSLILKKAHSGTYPVTLDGGLQIVRECLAALRGIRSQISGLTGSGALKKVDEIEWYDVKGRSQLSLLQEQADHWRDQLAAHLGIRRNRGGRSGGAVSLY